VGVLVLDKKGHPITDLKREDFAIEDEGARQEIRSFVAAGSGGAVQQATVPARSDEDEPRPFSNVVPVQGNVLAATGNTTILLIDAANLAFGDLNYARSEMLRFLKTLGPNEPVGLYVMKSRGFDVLLEPTTDAALLAATLRKWMPDARDLANAQEEERRNRRDIEYVNDLRDLFAVNGSSPLGRSAAAQPTDPQLRTMGQDPARDAFQMMPGIARKLGAISGHKSLVWVSSDNVLADWSDKASSVDRGNTQLDPLMLKAQEALNNAHVSIYPLDASQLEAGGVTASLPNGNVQLNPATSPLKIQAELDSLPPGEREEAEDLLAKSQRDINPGRVTDTMKQDMHPIQGPVRELANATGGHALRRAGDIAAELNGVVADGDAVYQISFSPSGQPDDAYHALTVKLVNHPGLTLRYRTGYLYSKEPATLKDRFRDAVWRPVDMSEIALTAHAEPDAKGSLIKLNIAAKDLGLTQQGERWGDKVDIFIAERDDSDLHAQLRGKTLALQLKSATYQDVMRDGINFEERVTAKDGVGSVRFVVVDENSGRMGSVTVPGEALRKKM
jgi:VWFA-related protein